MKRFHFHPPKPSSSGGPVRAEQAVAPLSPIHATDRGFRLSVPWQSSALISRQIQCSSSKKRVQPTNAADHTPSPRGSLAPMCDMEWTFCDTGLPERIVILLENRGQQI